jgi:hypothetical protein
MRCQKLAQRIVCTIVHGRRGEANLQCILVLADDFVSARSRLYANCKADCPIFLRDLHGELCPFSLSEQRRSNSDLGCAFFDGDLEIVGHAHREHRQHFCSHLCADRIAQFTQEVEVWS